ncbi:hypothetical protein QL992_02330 [Microbacterium sp. APC 3898]|uniref:DUF3955 domain-containing protein n=2 Tax=Planococcus TaxID=1372 RepID=A0ABT7ZGP9_9BACL|nr:MULTISPECIES: hypothetical protein [Terrabacteria group]MBF6633602.1 hypothetical protein [Planococcus sp. (in: firmicutes)]MBD8014097.1 hypothetical protein [Planococcus wigleyi]MDN3426337.1 hypothetical protein [Planococcus sp. APC 4016]MDN3438823.1 hypothetical protein [Planococcus sp. APC 3900]MDN3498033.1 hypothetical protein [Microbacterium sp. APC 3898]
MKDRIILAIILFCVLGAAAVSNIDFLSQTAKSAFYIVSMGILLIIGIVSLFALIKKGRNKEGM